MRTPNIASIAYTPGDPGEISDQAGVVRYLREMELRLQATFRALIDGYYQPIHVAPLKPRDGMVRHADGTDWNPGGGKGIYYYNGVAGIWVQLG